MIGFDGAARSRSAQECRTYCSQRIEKWSFLNAHCPMSKDGGLAETIAELAFAVLEPFAGPRLAIFLALTHTRIAGEQAFGFQDRAQVRVQRQ